MYIVIGLGNPGEEYKNTRHNTGRLAVEYLSKSELGSEKKIRFYNLDTFMNKSGSGVAKIIKNKAAAKNLIVIYDDLDLPLGSIKVSFNRGSGGHKGVESIINSLNTKEFIRIRIGISPLNLEGQIKKPQGEEKVQKFILGEFSHKEREVLEKMFNKAHEAIRLVSSERLSDAMTLINS